MVENKIVGADSISVRARSRRRRLPRAHIECAPTCFLSGAQRRDPQSFLFIISYLLFAHKTFHFCGTNSSSNRRVANSSLMPLM